MPRRRTQPPRYVPQTLNVNGLAALRVVLAARCLAIVLGILAVLGPPGAASAATLHILALGDSLTAGYGLPADDAFPARLEAALRERGHDVRIVNAGVSGDTSAGGKARIAWSLGGAPRPGAAIVALGSNDGLRGIEPGEMRANLAAILDALRAEGIPVLLAGMLAPRNLGPEYAAEFDAVFPDLAQEYDALLYPFLLEGVALDPARNQADGIHPNARGVARMVEGILPLAEKLIARARENGAAP